ncbi:hypothetical protein [Deinococcus sonorensis]|uniref:Uncharacterized protein n=2 Tax=Deinococcus sonorensis TaxID=309891 RepID=A0AAU7UCJ1_9DEIO
MYHLALGLTLLLLATLLLLGLSLQLGWRRDQARWPHHALYFAVCAGTVLTGLLALLGHQRWWPYPPLLLLLLGMARTRPGRAGHWRLAGLIALLYVGAAVWVW